MEVIIHVEIDGVKMFPIELAEKDHPIYTGHTDQHHDELIHGFCGRVWTEDHKAAPAYINVTLTGLKVEKKPVEGALSND